MAARLRHTLTHQQRIGLEQTMERSSHPVTRRAQALLLLHKGCPPRLVAERVAVSRSTVYAWHQRYIAEGIDGLADRPRSGRPLKGGGHYQQALEQALAHDPETLGYPIRGWTVPHLRDHLAQHTGITLSDGRMRALLHRLGYRYQRCQQRTAWPQSAFLNRLPSQGHHSLWTWQRDNPLSHAR